MEGNVLNPSAEKIGDLTETNVHRQHIAVFHRYVYVHE